MNCSTTRWFAFSALLALTCLFPTAARGEFLGSAISIRIWNADGDGQYDLNLPIPTDPWGWESDAPLNIYSASQPDRLLATIDAMSVYLDGDPAVTMNFAITAGSSNTLFSFTSSIVTFDPLLNADAYAAASLTLTDNNGNGASATGAFPGSTAYQARYNGGTVFANLITPFTAAANSTSTGSGRDPLTATEIIPGLIDEIQSEFRFTLSARDSASWTSRFQVNVPSNNIPEPSTYVLAMLGVASVFLARRRLKR